MGRKPLTDAAKTRAFKNAALDILVDMDGTICKWQYPEFGPPTYGVAEALGQMRKQGLRVVVWSSRLNSDIYSVEERAQAVEDIQKYMHHWNIPFDEIDTQGKRLALCYVDDKAVSFFDSKIGWLEVLAKLKIIREEVEAAFAKN